MGGEKVEARGVAPSSSTSHACCGPAAAWLAAEPSALQPSSLFTSLTGLALVVLDRPAAEAKGANPVGVVGSAAVAAVARHAPITPTTTSAHAGAIAAGAAGWSLNLQGRGRTGGA